MKGIGAIKKLLVCIGCMSFMGLSLAASDALKQCDETGLSTKQKAQIKSLVQEAQDVADASDIQNASKELMSPKFIHDDLYVFVIDNNYYTLAHGGRSDLVGINLKTIPDVSESAQKIIDKAKHGGGWVSYLWTNFKGHAPQCKTSWVTPLIKDQKNNTMYTIGAGLEH